MSDDFCPRCGQRVSNERHATIADLDRAGRLTPIDPDAPQGRSPQGYALRRGEMSSEHDISF